MINLTALNNRIEISPYDTYLITDLLEPRLQKLLADHYPSQYFKEFTPQTGNENIDKNFVYKFEFFTLNKFETTYLHKLGFYPLWIDLIKNLISPSYVENLGKIVNLNLLDKTYSIEFMRYRPGDSAGAHYDKQTNKVLTQIFYFNTYWDTSWGGYLQILNPSNIEQTVLAIPPLANYSVVIKPTQNAWHKVCPLSASAKQSRINMVLEFYK